MPRLADPSEEKGEKGSGLAFGVRKRGQDLRWLDLRWF